MATVIGRNRNKKAKKSFKDMTVTEIKKQLDELGIEYDKPYYHKKDSEGGNRMERKDIKKIIDDLDINYREDREVLQDILNEVTSIALDISNRKNTEINRIKLFPYIKKTVKSIYLTRGGEGLQSRGEGSISNSYEDIIEKLRNDIIKSGLRRIL